MGSNWIAWVLVIAAGINNCIANLMLKQSRLVAPDGGLQSLLFSPWMLGGLVFLGINVILYGKALDKLPVSVAYPVLAGLGFILIAIASHFLFRERLNVHQWIGMGVTLAGIILLSRSHSTSIGN